MIRVIPLLLLLINCGGSGSTIQKTIDRQEGDQDNFFVGDPQKISLHAFKEHVAPVVQMCVDCHGDQQTPLFAVNDHQAAHLAVLESNIVNFDDTSQSRLVLRLTIDKHNCSQKCEADGDRMLEALNAWQQARHTAPTEKHESYAHKLADGNLDFDLSEIINENVRLTLQASPLDAGEGYKLHQIKLITSSKPIYIADLQPLINGEQNLLNKSLSDIACAVQPPHSVIMRSTTIAADETATSDKISFTIGELRLANSDDPICRSADATTVDPGNNGGNSGNQDSLAAKRESYINDMRDNLFNEYCSCHDNYTSRFSAVWLNKDEIARRVKLTNNLQMPPLGMPEEIKEELLEWLEE